MATAVLTPTFAFTRAHLAAEDPFACFAHFEPSRSKRPLAPAPAAVTPKLAGPVWGQTP